MRLMEVFKVGPEKLWGRLRRKVREVGPKEVVGKVEEGPGGVLGKVELECKKLPRWLQPSSSVAGVSPPPEPWGWGWGWGGGGEGAPTCPSADQAREVHWGGSALLLVLITSCFSSSTMIFPSRSCGTGHPRGQ